MGVDDLNTINFFFQAEDGIRDKLVTGVQTCALPIWFGAGGGVGLLLAQALLHVVQNPAHIDVERLVEVVRLDAPLEAALAFLEFVARQMQHPGLEQMQEVIGPELVKRPPSRLGLRDPAAGEMEEPELEIGGHERRIQLDRLRHLLRGAIIEAHLRVLGGEHVMQASFARLQVESPLQIRDRLLVTIFLRRLQRELQQFIDVEPFYGGLFHLNLSQGSSLAGTRMNWPFILSPCAAAGHYRSGLLAEGFPRISPDLSISLCPE